MCETEAEDMQMSILGLMMMLDQTLQVMGWSVGCWFFTKKDHSNGRDL